MKGLVIKTFSELEAELTEKQRAEANKMFREFYPEGTPEVMCVSEVPEREDYLREVDLEDFN